MKRALVLFVTLLGLTIASPAMAKPSIAVLGLEVVEDTDIPDAKAAAYADALTDALRQRARVGSGPYSLAAGSDKSLVEMKLLSGCDNEANGCMAGIGTELTADRLVFGHVQKVGANYQISLKLINVESKTVERTTSEVSPVSESSSADITALGKKLYAKITGVSNQGTLIVKANVENGDVYLDGERKASLSGGTARLEGLAAGDYKLKVETDCYLAYEGTISVGGGKDTQQEVELEKNALAKCDGAGGGNGNGNGNGKRVISGGSSEDERPGGGSRAMFWVSTAGAVAGAATFGFARMQMNDLEPKCIPASGGAAERDVMPGSGACDDGHFYSKIAYAGGGAAIVFGAAAAYFYYKGYIASKHSERPLNARAPRRKPSNVLVAPTVTATTVGGVVHIEF